MKKTILISACVLTASVLLAQKEIRNKNGSYYKQCARFAISQSISELSAKYPLKEFAQPKLAADQGSPVAKLLHATYNPNAAIVDGAIQREQGFRQSVTPIVDINGASGQGYVPLDPNGMIGSNYYVQTVNSVYSVYDKTGKTILAQTDLAKLFGSFTCDDGDPVTMYDRFADRWIITEFQENGACGSSNDAIDTLMIAVSQTNDPTGKFYLYYFCPDNTDYADYPKYSIWADGYYQTCNCQNDKVTVYERAKMLNGDSTAGFIVVPFNNNPWNVGGQGGFFCPMTMNADGQLPPYGTPDYLMYFNDDNWGSGFTDELIIDSVSINWTTKSGTLGQYQTLPTEPFDSYFSYGTERDIDQPGELNSFDALDGFVSYRIPYLRWGSYNAAVLCYPVNVSKTPTAPNVTGGTELAGVRWYEIRQDTTTKQWSIYQQSTYAPNDSINRWNPSIAMDMNGSIALCYSVSDKTSTYPGTRFTGRAACDTLGKMTVMEGIGAVGSKNVTTYNRWGDYSHTSVDPIDGITFWHTNLYSDNGRLSSKIFSFQVSPVCPTGIPGISNPVIGVTAYQQGNTINVNASGLTGYTLMKIDIYDNLGKHITGKNIAPGPDKVTAAFDASSLARGIYYVRLGNDEVQRVVKVAIVR